MIVKCKGCPIKFESNGKKKFHSPKCKKNYENSQRSAPKKKEKKQGKVNPQVSLMKIICPQYLNEIAAAYWDKVAPTVIARGHLNVLSEDTFAELCDLYSRLQDINTMINMGTVQKCDGCGAEIKMPGNRSLLQVDDKWSINDGIETKTFKESALSDLKRKYSKQFLDYCKQFYLTPLSNRGNFGIEDETKEDDKKTGKERFFQNN
jgi:phage terminase small subunit